MLPIRRTHSQCAAPQPLRGAALFSVTDVFLLASEATTLSRPDYGRLFRISHMSLAVLIGCRIESNQMALISHEARSGLASIQCPCSIAPRCNGHDMMQTRHWRGRNRCSRSNLCGSTDVVGLFMFPSFAYPPTLHAARRFCNPTWYSPSCSGTYRMCAHRAGSPSKQNPVGTTDPKPVF